MVKSDSTTTIKDLRKQTLRFVKERNWEQFQNMRSLAISLSLEANELLDHFQWLNDAEVDKIEKDEAKIEEFAMELADILAYLLIASNKLNIDLSKAFYSKMDLNNKKYIAERFKYLTWKEDNKVYQEIRNEHLKEIKLTQSNNRKNKTKKP